MKVTIIMVLALLVLAACAPVDYGQDVERILCTPEQIELQGEPVACTMEYAPVCGYDADENQLDTFGNSCVACNAVGVVAYEEGEC